MTQIALLCYIFTSVTFEQDTLRMSECYVFFNSALHYAAYLYANDLLSTSLISQFIRISELNYYVAVFLLFFSSGNGTVEWEEFYKVMRKYLLNRTIDPDEEYREAFKVSFDLITQCL